MPSTDDELPQPGPPFRLGEWLVEPSLNRVSCGDSSHQLALKVMEVLAFLAENAGSMVPKQRIIDAVWRTEFITENTLTQAIADLRRAFDDDARNPRFIETITKRGYRLIPEVEYLDITPPTPATSDFPCAVVLDDKEILLAAGENLIGRTREAIVRIDSDEVSRHHARIVVSSQDAVLEDLGSKNGTLLWGTRVGEPTPLRDGDEITAGPATLTFRQLASLRTTRSAQPAPQSRES